MKITEVTKVANNVNEIWYVIDKNNRTAVVGPFNNRDEAKDHAITWPTAFRTRKEFNTPDFEQATPYPIVVTNERVPRGSTRLIVQAFDQGGNESRLYDIVERYLVQQGKRIHGSKWNKDKHLQFVNTTLTPIQEGGLMMTSVLTIVPKGWQVSPDIVKKDLEPINTDSTFTKTSDKPVQAKAKEIDKDKLGKGTFPNGDDKVVVDPVTKIVKKITDTDTEVKQTKKVELARDEEYDYMGYKVVTTNKGESNEKIDVRLPGGDLASEVQDDFKPFKNTNEAEFWIEVHKEIADNKAEAEKNETGSKPEENEASLQIDQTIEHKGWNINVWKDGSLSVTDADDNTTYDWDIDEELKWTNVEDVKEWINMQQKDPKAYKEWRKGKGLDTR